MRDSRYSLMGPAILITVGTLFLFHEFIPEYRIGRLWPVILIVIGVIRLFEAATGTGCAPDTPVATGNPPGASGTPSTGGPSATSGS